VILGYLYLQGNKYMEFSGKNLAMLPKHVKCQYPIIYLPGKHFQINTKVGMKINSVVF